nr:hypothetical protein [Tanacetum cinerariifolium]
RDQGNCPLFQGGARRHGCERPARSAGTPTDECDDSYHAPDSMGLRRPDGDVGHMEGFWDHAGFVIKVGNALLFCQLIHVDRHDVVAAPAVGQFNGLRRDVAPQRRQVRRRFLRMTFHPLPGLTQGVEHHLQDLGVRFGEARIGHIEAVVIGDAAGAVGQDPNMVFTLLSCQERVPYRPGVDFAAGKRRHTVWCLQINRSDVLERQSGFFQRRYQQKMAAR